MSNFPDLITIEGVRFIVLTWFVFSVMRIMAIESAVSELKRIREILEKWNKPKPGI